MKSTNIKKVKSNPDVEERLLQGYFVQSIIGGIGAINGELVDALSPIDLTSKNNEGLKKRKIKRFLKNKPYLLLNKTVKELLEEKKEKSRKQNSSLRFRLNTFNKRETIRGFLISRIALPFLERDDEYSFSSVFNKLGLNVKSKPKTDKNYIKGKIREKESERNKKILNSLIQKEQKRAEKNISLFLKSEQNIRYIEDFLKALLEDKSFKQQFDSFSIFFNALLNSDKNSAYKTFIKLMYRQKRLPNSLMTKQESGADKSLMYKNININYIHKLFNCLYRGVYGVFTEVEKEDYFFNAKNSLDSLKKSKNIEINEVVKDFLFMFLAKNEKFLFDMLVNSYSGSYFDQSGNLFPKILEIAEGSDLKHVYESVARNQKRIYRKNKPSKFIVENNQSSKGFESFLICSTKEELSSLYKRKFSKKEFLLKNNRSKIVEGCDSEIVINAIQDLFYKLFNSCSEMNYVLYNHPNNFNRVVTNYFNNRENLTINGVPYGQKILSFDFLQKIEYIFSSSFNYPHAGFENLFELLKHINYNNFIQIIGNDFVKTLLKKSDIDEKLREECINWQKLPTYSIQSLSPRLKVEFEKEKDFIFKQKYLFAFNFIKNINNDIVGLLSISDHTKNKTLKEAMEYSTLLDEDGEFLLDLKELFDKLDTTTLVFLIIFLKFGLSQNDLYSDLENLFNGKEPWELNVDEFLNSNLSIYFLQISLKYIAWRNIFNLSQENIAKYLAKVKEVLSSAELLSVMFKSTSFANLVDYYSDYSYGEGLGALNNKYEEKFKKTIVKNFFKLFLDKDFPRNKSYIFLKEYISSTLIEVDIMLSLCEEEKDLIKKAQKTIKEKDEALFLETVSANNLESLYQDRIEKDFRFKKEFICDFCKKIQNATILYSKHFPTFIKRYGNKDEWNENNLTLSTDTYLKPLFEFIDSEVDKSLALSSVYKNLIQEEFEESGEKDKEKFFEKSIVAKSMKNLFDYLYRVDDVDNKALKRFLRNLLDD